MARRITITLTPNELLTAAGCIEFCADKCIGLGIHESEIVRYNFKRLANKLELSANQEEKRNDRTHPCGTRGFDSAPLPGQRFRCDRVLQEGIRRRGNMSHAVAGRQQADARRDHDRWQAALSGG